MSYLPSSRLYEREQEPVEAPVEAPKPKPAREPLTTIVAQTVVAPHVEAPEIMPAVVPQATEPVVHELATPKPTPIVGPKEWLVAPPPMLHVDIPKEAPEPTAVQTETVTSPAPSAPEEQRPGRKRNLFHKARRVVLRHIDRAKNGKPIEGDPDVLWFAVMTAGSLCMGLMIWGAYSALPRFGMAAPLRAGGATPTLKVTSDVVPVVRWGHDANQIAPHPASHQAPPPPPQVHVEPKVSAHPMLAVPDFPPPVERPLEPLPERKDPAIFVHANLGETPMIRTWKKLAETSFLLASMSMPTANLFAGGQDKAQPDYSKQIADLTKAVQNLSEQVNALKLDDKLGAVKSELNEKISKIKIDKADNSVEVMLRLEQLEKMIDRLIKNPGIAAAPAIGSPAAANLDDIKNKLTNIEQAILNLRPADKRIALSPPTQEAGNAKAVILVNLYSQDLWLWVNQKSYRVPAGTTLTLDNIPVGPATIEVRSPEGIFHRANPTLLATETFTLTAR